MASLRRKRLRWTVVFLVSAVALGAAIGGGIYLSSRPEPYRPGEDDDDLTRSLDRNLPPDAPAPRFTDVTAEAGLSGFVHFSGERTSQLPEDMGSGAAWGDYDDDGDDDLFLVSSGGSLDLDPAQRGASELYENLGDGTFRRVESFPEIRILGMGAAWGDYDGDRRLDLVVTGYNSLALYHNRPGGFERDRRFPDPPGYWAGAAWADYDRDGDLDLYVCGYVQYVEDDADRARATMQYGRSVPYTLNPASYPPDRNLLFRNEGDGTFTEIAEEAGVNNLEGRSLGALWHDLDEDGWLELYVANDISDNVLYRNAQGRLEEISHAAWVADYRGAMGLAAGDWNRDGDDDLFITHWVAQENALYDSLLADTDRETPELRFMDVADQRGLGQIALRRVGWGSEFADLDRDGWLDLVVANGSTFETEEPPKRLRPQRPFVLWNQQAEYFHDLAPSLELLSVPHVTRGLAVCDYDDDGDLDLLFMHHGEGAQLLRNDMQGGNWLKVRLRGPSEGARLLLHAGGAVLRRAVSSASYLSQSCKTVHFGLGEQTAAERLEVRWPDGETTIYHDLEAGATWVLSRDDPQPRRIGPIKREAATTGTAGLDEDAKRQLIEFWNAQREAVRAMKVDGDLDKAIRLFRQALALKPDHEDSLYYLANCLAAREDVPGATDNLERLIEVNPQSHRGLRRLATLVALQAKSPEELDPAVELLERSLAVNPEETGSLLLLGEIALLRDDLEAAEQQLGWACRTNPRAAGGFFMRGYVAWRKGNGSRAREMLEQTRTALGEEWKPRGMTAEGDVEEQLHEDRTPLSRFWQSWDGSPDPEAAFADLHAHLAGFR